jgi:Arc/MetJ-type ribon-helix-helix transcriptional regulator
MTEPAPRPFKNKMITFRLTAAEYDHCRDLCETGGFRSVSSLARAAIDLLLQQPARPHDITLEARIAALEARLNQLTQELEFHPKPQL